MASRVTPSARVTRSPGYKQTWRPGAVKRSLGRAVRPKVGSPAGCRGGQGRIGRSGTRRSASARTESSASSVSAPGSSKLSASHPEPPTRTKTSSIHSGIGEQLERGSVGRAASTAVQATAVTWLSSISRRPQAAGPSRTSSTPCRGRPEAVAGLPGLHQRTMVQATSPAECGGRPVLASGARRTRGRPVDRRRHRYGARRLAAVGRTVVGRHRPSLGHARSQHDPGLRRERRLRRSQSRALVITPGLPVLVHYERPAELISDVLKIRE
jgi:hypothetical protein